MVIFQYAPEIVERFPSVVGGVIYGEQMKNGPSPQALQEAFQAEQRAVLERIGNTPLSQIPSLAAWRSAFREFGIEPTQYRSAAEALLRRLTKKGNIPSINTLVDIGNLVSIRYALPTAVFDMRSITGTLTVHVASGKERYTTLGRDEVDHPDPGEVVFSDGTGLVMARRWCWRQSEQSAAQLDTNTAIITIEGHHERAHSDIEAALRDLLDLLRTYAGGNFTTDILYKQHTASAIPATRNQALGDSMQSTISHTLPATKITQAFERARQKGQGVLIPYFMCGYPSREQSIQLMLAAISGGADILELGLPFSDPLADGATTQHAGHLALGRGMTLQACLEIAGQVAAARSAVPLILMGYYNPLLAYGLERFCENAAASGVSGLIIPDLPPEEATTLQKLTRQHGLALIFLVPPTTPDERIAYIVKMAAQEPKGFLYGVSLSGVTGARSSLPPHLAEFIQRVSGYTKEQQLPIAVGFGISTPEHVAEVIAHADGAVVGSALVKLIDSYPEAKQVEAVKQYITSMKEATKRPNEL